MTKEEINKQIKELELKKVSIEAQLTILKTQLRKLKDDKDTINKKVQKTNN